MKKKIVSIIMAMFMLVGTATAQVFIMDEDAANNRTVRDGVVFNTMVPTQDVNNDQYIPLGEGVLLLSGLAGAYLLRRRKRD